MAAKPSPQQKSEKPQEAAPLPEWEALGVQRQDGGRVLVLLRMRGDTLVSRKVLYGPDVRAIVNERFRVEASKRCLS